MNTYCLKQKPNNTNWNEILILKEKVAIQVLELYQTYTPIKTNHQCH